MAVGLCFYAWANVGVVWADRSEPLARLARGSQSQGSRKLTCWSAQALVAQRVCVLARGASY